MIADALSNRGSEMLVGFGLLSMAGLVSGVAGVADPSHVSEAVGSVA